ncbi:hypothetical protein KP509_22G078000 [Ceratopteris richardii]|nr:hypothetical protein KP509_22G078000 [Ceratopteris richardii]KAH7307796.1 hypothetical protein KP509_22G078000 [Ceratopteris richardii]
MFISWLPFYSAAKLSFVVYLWYPDTKGTEYVFQTYLKPLVSKHTESLQLDLGDLRNETERILLIFRTRLMVHLQSKISQLQHQAGTVTPALFPQPVQESVMAYNPTVSLFPLKTSKEQQQRGHFPSSVYKPSTTQSAIWPDEGHKQYPRNLGLHESLIVLAAGQKTSNQLLKRNIYGSQPALHAEEDLLMAKRTGRFLVPTGEHKNNLSDKEENDFELVPRPTEVSMPLASGEVVNSQSDPTTSGQKTQSRWWRWW